MVNIGLIGCGGFARFALRAVAGLADVRLAALADPLPANRQAAADLWRQLRPCEDPPQQWEDAAHLLDKAHDVAAVLIMTPPHLHY
ncbi:MAG: Gfo/Idh/MocA family oxidoreductase, partial [Clostridia bacterium]|nr:Gfo/Idh/MocA family oxidoreductase [Clostridia bacterium]